MPTRDAILLKVTTEAGTKAKVYQKGLVVGGNNTGLIWR
jgi:hypothetical protein